MAAKPWTEHTIRVDGKRSFYLEAGEGEPLVLLHGGEFGACGEFTWEFNIEALSKHFRVIAPDWLGYGKSEKLFSFENMLDLRIDHMAKLIRGLGVEAATFMGSSMGGTTLIGALARGDKRLPVKQAVLCSGGGFVPDNDDRKILTDYDGTIEHMRRIYQVLFKNPAIRDNEAMIQRHWEASMEPGAWECTAAPRFKAPTRPKKPFAPPPPDYSGIDIPVLIVAGKYDNLRLPDYGYEVQKQIPNSDLIVLEGGHCHQIDMPEVYNDAVLKWLLR